MKVKVQQLSVMDKVEALLCAPGNEKARAESWAKCVQQLPSSALQVIVRNHANDRANFITTDEMYVLLEELVRRREASGESFKSDEEALADFRRHYMPHAIRKPAIRLN